MDLRAIKIQEIGKENVTDHFRPRGFNERTIVARIINPPILKGYGEIVDYFLQNENAYNLCVARHPKSIAFFRQSYPIKRRGELINLVAGYAGEDHIKRNHIFIDLRKKEGGRYVDDSLTIYFSENEMNGDTPANDAMENMPEKQERTFTVSKLIVPQTFAHCFTLEGNLRDKMNFYQKIEAAHLPNFKEKKQVIAAQEFESFFRAG